jgi:hypothetical protein
MTNSKRTVEKLELDPFALKLPLEMASIKPLWEISLPGKHVGLVFKETISPNSYARCGRSSYRMSDDAAGPVNGWRYMVRRKDGKPATNDRVGQWAGQFYDNLLDLKLAIEFDAVALIPKTRTRRERDDYED